jgi:hypothetical protein
MESMDELNAQLEAEFFEALKGEGEPVKFSPEEIKASEEWCRKLYKEEGKMEAMVRKERVLAAARPDLYLA